MKPSLVKVALRNSWKRRTNSVTMMWGPPGVAKSQLVHQLGAELGVEVREMRPALMDAVDAHGLPVPDLENRIVHWLHNAILPRDGSDPDDGILFLDEIVQGPPSVLNALSELILDRRLGTYRFPHNWMIIAAGNPVSSRAASSKMPLHLANRMEHIMVEVDHDDWARHAISREFHASTIGFIRWDPSCLHKFDPSDLLDEAKSPFPAFPTPRSWEFVSDFLKSDPADEILLEKLQGIIGMSMASKFWGFLQIYRELPPIELIHAAPESAPVPTKSEAVWGTCGALVSNATDTKKLDATVVYARRLPAEYGTLTLRDLYFAKGASFVGKSKEYRKFAAAQADDLLFS